jgi:cytochrome c553
MRDVPGTVSELFDSRPTGASNRGEYRRRKTHFIRGLGAGALALAFSINAWAEGEAKAAAAPDAAKGQQIVSQVCGSCHGPDGNGTSPTYPKLAAQHPEYLIKQLHNFRAEGGKPAQRANAVMLAFATQLSDDDVRNVAAYFSGQKLKPAAAKNKDTVALGQKIYRGGIAEKGVPACAACHGPSGAGIPAQYPRLAGQYADYTEAQLVAFRQGARGNSVQMMQIAARLSDAEMKAVADYVAGLR